MKLMRFRLRGLFVALLVIAIACAFAADMRRRNSAIETLESFSFHFNYEGSIARILRRPTVAAGGSSDFSSEGLQLLGRIPTIRTLVLWGELPGLSNDVSLPTRTLKNLRHLVLPTNADDSALAQIVNATHLTYLSLGENTTDSRLLETAQELNRLKGLAVSGARISNATLRELSKACPRLVYLDISARDDETEHCRLDPATIESFDGLQTVVLRHRNLDDLCLQSLANVTSLEKVVVDEACDDIVTMWKPRFEITTSNKIPLDL